MTVVVIQLLRLLQDFKSDSIDVLPDSHLHYVRLCIALMMKYFCTTCT